MSFPGRSLARARLWRLLKRARRVRESPRVGLDTLIGMRLIYH
jgi:hypothetical protein